MKLKISILVSTIIILVFVLGFFYRDEIFVWYTTPSHTFDQSPKTKQLDYSLVNAWFSLPELNDDADIILKELEKEVQETKEADVFFIHLTTYFSSYSWNQDLNNEDGIYDPANWLSSQVSVFNKCCRIFSPRYRQATFMSYFGKEDGFRARDLAFKDILASFDHYINKYNDGRPIIIAGHSQGAELGMRLLYERFHNKPLREQLVTAYIPGWTFSSKDLLEVMPDIPPCKSKSQLSCLNTWRTTGKSYNFDTWPVSAYYFHLHNWINASGKKLVCTNPITWTDKNIAVSKDHNQGSFLPMDNDKINQFEKFAGAQCSNGVVIAEVDDKELEIIVKEGDYHFYDFNFYYVDIRNNAVNRTKKWYISRN